jgi:hypothetical protein
MAAITSSAVTDLDPQGGYSVGSASNKLVGFKRRVSIALTAQGGTAGDIPASVLGYKRLKKVSLLYFLTGGSANANVGVTLDSIADNNNILTFTAIDGSTAAANVTGTLAVELDGDLN